jgi:hypothetical protein
MQRLSVACLAGNTGLMGSWRLQAPSVEALLQLDCMQRSSVLAWVDGEWHSARCVPQTAAAAIQ